MADNKLAKIEKVESKASSIMGTLASASLLITTAATSFPMVFADGGIDAGKEAITGVLSLLYMLMLAIGILFIAIGIVKLAIAHNQEDSPTKDKAVQQIATGIILMIAPVVLDNIGFENWLVEKARTPGGAG